jgi:hypothetical protein
MRSLYEMYKMALPTGRCLEPDESSQHFIPYFFKIGVGVILP